MNKKMYQRQSKSKSTGKTLTGILIGLILGAIIIAVLLWFLNQQRPPVEPDRTQSAEQVEIIIPNQAVLPESSMVSDTMASAVSNVEETVDEWVQDGAEMLATEENDVAVLPPVIKPSAPTPPQSSLNQVPTKPVAPKEVEVKKPIEKVEPAAKAPTKPSAEQILEHGSVEKAREAAKPQTVTKEAAPKASNHQRSGKVQAGSYAKAEQAEAQRAKLALLGISTHVETAQVKGQTVHRVRTAPLSGEQVAQVRQTLKQQGIDAIAVSGQ